MKISSISEQYQMEYIRKLFPLLEIPSVYTESENYLYGKPIDDALNYLLDVAKEDGFIVKNVDGQAGHIEFGDGEDIIGILGHLDVVPAGEDWNTLPFSPILKNGNIYARGVQDDKGPVMAAYIALKILKDQGFQPKKRIRLIVGTDEERDWKGIEHYFKKESMPEFGFSPDASFPVIHAEKGLLDDYFTFPVEQVDHNSLLLLTSGDRLNMVPDFARAEVILTNDIDEKFADFLKLNNLTGSIKYDDNLTKITIDGKPAHASTPERGVNAAIKLLNFLKTIGLSHHHHKLVSLIHDSLEDTSGKGLQCSYKDDVSGELTCNMGMIHWENGKGCRVGINVRYPVTIGSLKIVGKLERFAKAGEGSHDIYDHLEALHIKKEHPYVQTLLEVYNNVMNEDETPKSMGGATYARALKSGVAFGALFKDSPDTAHQKNEHVRMDDMMKSIMIYAKSLYQLTK
ncbi:dipeptidase PepV [Halobacillus seohaensis]|uniref:Dipeptidase PepV n=1 Tax=Halobacillus seohaensis TaxID=447421 RepID=A0ABW2EKJ5_9BACI